MACRLCLKDISDKTSIPLFVENSNTQTEIHKMITNFFDFTISYDDVNSTNICEDCANKIKAFENWRQYIQNQQNSLQNVFVEVNCCSNTKTEELEDIANPKIEDFYSDDDFDVVNCNTFLSDDEHNLINDCVKEKHYVGIKGNLITNIDGNDELEEYNNIKLDLFSNDDEVPLLNFVLSKSKLKNSKHEKRINTNTLCEPIPSTQHNKIKIVESFIQLTCDVCKISVESYDALQSHFNLLHNIPPYVKCCSKTYTKLNRLVEHIEWHQNPEKFKCTICNKLTSSKSYLEKHINSHSLRERPKRSCSICNKEYRGSKCYRSHNLEEKDIMEINCDLCNKCFMTPQRLRRHIDSIHNNICPYVCDICGKKYKFKPSFDRHVLEHQGIVEPPQQCDICNEWLKNKHSLRLHRFTHMDINTDCKICGRTCPSRTALLRHVNYSHKLQKNLSCNYCDRTFKQEKNLKEHMAIHTGLQLYSCPHCAKECRSKSNMYVHIKRKHVDEWLKSKIAKSNNPNLK
ncbi:transcription factor grauzone-like isoform X1 [Teleopsis dalmanni]|uniref:transcription factor grauzone-like isoform X1 n=1 Tax=Teleopsis dalmanni TaxID=139649 RepID=UPI0018CE5366|nr:transcription factor grauzone-like isoform X1 [Teleopsis dalmanni]